VADEVEVARAGRLTERARVGGIERDYRRKGSRRLRSRAGRRAERWHRGGEEHAVEDSRERGVRAPGVARWELGVVGRRRWGRAGEHAVTPVCGTGYDRSGCGGGGGSHGDARSGGIRKQREEVFWWWDTVVLVLALRPRGAFYLGDSFVAVWAHR
jgi:hypothetical protein